MTSLTGRARKYLASIEPAVAGQAGHNATFRAAMALAEGFDLPENDVATLLTEWNAQCQPPWSDRELAHKVDEALRKTAASTRRGYLIGTTPSRKNGTPSSSSLPDTISLDNPLPDPTARTLSALFRPGEHVCFTAGTIDDTGKEIPAGRGSIEPVEFWLDKLASKPIDEILSRSEPTGLYMTMNPTSNEGRDDSHVIFFRHALLEFDGISLPQQLDALLKSRVPMTALTFSGARSLHAIVPILARSRTEYDRRVKALYEYFADMGLDQQNINPARLTRAPGASRAGTAQALLALNVNLRPIDDWIDIATAEDSAPASLRPSRLLSLNPDDASTTLLGKNRYICKGHSAMLVGPSGIGKSTLQMQFMACAAVGRPFFGIRPAFALSQLLIQAENDELDLAEMLQSVIVALEFTKQERTLLDSNLSITLTSTHTGDDFIALAKRLILTHAPDMIWADPLMSYIGADISDQAAVSKFLRNGLQPLLNEHSTAWVWIHHTGKPPKQGSRVALIEHELSYAGIGSSDLANWARAIWYLKPYGDGKYAFHLAKRGQRAGVPSPIWMQHSKTGTVWERTDPPEKEERNAQPVSEAMREFLIAQVADGVDKVRVLCEHAMEHFSISQSRFYKYYWLDEAKRLWVSEREKPTP